MSDREFLIWLHERMEHVHWEHRLVDYMHKLRAIIANTPKEQVSPSSGCNSMEQLKKTILDID